MSLPVPLVVGHHQGSGAPSDLALAELGARTAAMGRYTYGVGLTRWERFIDDPTAPSPGGDTSTGDHNRTSLGIVLTGNRSNYPLTLRDQVMLFEIGEDARARGFITATPEVLPHRNVPGNLTECCGNLVAPPAPPAYPLGNELAWLSFVSSVLGHVPPTIGADVPGDKETVAAYTAPDGSGAWALQYDGGVETLHGAFHGSYWSLDPSVRNNPNRRFLAITGRTDGKPAGYALVSTAGEAYNFPT